MERTVEGWNPLILYGTPKAKAFNWGDLDAKGRKLGERMGWEWYLVPLICKGKKKSGYMLEQLSI